MNKGMKLICQLDGYNYYLGGVIAKNLSWHSALSLVSELGNGWELPNRPVALLAHHKLREDLNSIEGCYWLSDPKNEFSAWVQFSDGDQHYIDKTIATNRYVRPVLKIKV